MHCDCSLVRTQTQKCGVSRSPFGSGPVEHGMMHAVLLWAPVMRCVHARESVRCPPPCPLERRNPEASPDVCSWAESGRSIPGLERDMSTGSLMREFVWAWPEVVAQIRFVEWLPRLPVTVPLISEPVLRSLSA